MLSMDVLCSTAQQWALVCVRRLRRDAYARDKKRVFHALLFAWPYRYRTTAADKSILLVFHGRI